MISHGSMNHSQKPGPITTIIMRIGSSSMRQATSDVVSMIAGRADLDSVMVFLKGSSLFPFKIEMYCKYLDILML